MNKTKITGDASYGEHYYFKERNDNHPYYIQAPLYKSHKKVIYRTINIFHQLGFRDYLINKIYMMINIIYYLSSGNNINEGDMSIHVIALDENDNILKHEIIELNERVRDILNLIMEI